MRFVRHRGTIGTIFLEPWTSDWFFSHPYAGSEKLRAWLGMLWLEINLLGWEMNKIFRLYLSWCGDRCMLSVITFQLILKLYLHLCHSVFETFYELWQKKLICDWNCFWSFIQVTMNLNWWKGIEIWQSQDST